MFFLKKFLCMLFVADLGQRANRQWDFLAKESSFLLRSSNNIKAAAFNPLFLLQ